MKGVSFMKIIPLFLLIGGLILLTLCLVLLVQIATYKLRTRKSSLPICICFIILAVADIVTGISALGGA